MKTLRLIYILGGLIALWGIVSCTEELKINAGYRKVSVPISYTLSATSETRATEIKPNA